MMPGPLQIILVLLVILLLFGASRVPGIARIWQRNHKLQEGA
ncbi:MAG: twin-arginine translocase TatA/TatE family subunit [Alphaproteobacteria bacterium]